MSTYRSAGVRRLVPTSTSATILKDSSNRERSATASIEPRNMPSTTTNSKRRRMNSDDEDEDNVAQTNGLALRDGRVRRPRISREDDDDEDDNEDDVDQESSSHRRAQAKSEGEVDERQTRKRARGRGGSNAEPDSSVTQSIAPAIAPKKRAKDGYLPGSIVRVKLKNFVTYDAVEFSPGPNLNMIIGPNGTGKSTIVCAIALGLGWRPTVVGRAKEIAQYVKQGQEESMIELELKSAREGENNTIIERHFSRSSNESKWRLDRKDCSTTLVRERVDKFGIDVSNLCCFLPQDKVASFAQMDATELLKETQKAAGHKDMPTWHGELIEKGEQQRTLTTSLREKMNEANILEDNLQILERDVERARERDQLKVNVEVLKLAHDHARYEVRRKQYNDLKAQRNNMKEELRALQRQLQPLQDKVVVLEDEKKSFRSSMERTKSELARDSSAMKKHHDELEKLGSEGQTLVEELGSLRNREKESDRHIANLRVSIEELTERIRAEPPEPDTQRQDAQMSELRDKGREVRQKMADMQDRHREIEREISNLNRELDSKRMQLAELDNVGHARLQQLEKADRATFRAVLWLRENETLFQQKVYEPPYLTLSVKNPERASAVENCINWSSLKTFVCQNQEDYDTFGRMMDRQNLRVNFCDRGRARELDEFRRPATQEELEMMGFEHYIIDMVEGPDLVLRFLCADLHLHTIPFAINERTVDLPAVEQSRRFQRFITGSNQHTIQYSQYGNRHAQTLTRVLREARTFIHSIDQGLRRELDGRLQEINERKAAVEEETRMMKGEEDRCVKRFDQLKEEIRKHEQRKGELRRAHQEWEKAKVNLESKQIALRKEQQRPSFKMQTSRIHMQLDRVHDKIQAILDEVKVILVRQSEARGNFDVQCLESLTCEERLIVLRRVKAEQESRYEDTATAFERVKAMFETAKQSASALLDGLKEALSNADPRIKEEFKALEAQGMSIERLEERLNIEDAKLQACLGVDPSVLDDYNARREKLKDVETSIASVKRKKEKVDSEVERLRELWIPALNDLVKNVNDKFAHAFRAIGNAGEVQIAQDEDYGKWGIKILVKFRDEEKLQQLNAHRQSGGERSISTITYLLSLTEMSRAPFSLVDEINQGMDQKYERQVHDHMVKVTCQGDQAGQYFLITPKLLPNLTYDAKMRVLIINNGEYLPETFNLRRFVRRRGTQARNGRPRMNGVVTVS